MSDELEMAAMEMTYIGTGTTCPFVTDQHTEWEAQEIRSAWRAAISGYDDVLARVLSAREKLASGVTPTLHPYANDIQHLAVAIAKATALAGMIQSSGHRMHREEKGQ